MHIIYIIFGKPDPLYLNTLITGISQSLKGGRGVCLRWEGGLSQEAGPYLTPAPLPNKQVSHINNVPYHNGTLRT